MLGRIFTVGGYTLLSRLTGFARDIMLAAILGAGPVADAFFIAFRLPNHFRAIFAEGAFNAAFVPAGASSAISVFVSDPSDVFFDIDGYFAPPLASGLKFYPVTPCRVADTRAFAGMTGAFGPPSLGAGAPRTFPLPPSSCGIPTTASAYSVNITAVPTTKYLGWLSTWPAGTAQPVVSTLNAWDGLITANAAFVPAGPNSGINVFVSDPSDVFFDINGYFAP